MGPAWSTIHGTRRERVLAALKAGPATSAELRARFGDATRTELSRLCRDGSVVYDKNEQTFRLAAAPAHGVPVNG